MVSHAFVSLAKSAFLVSDLSFHRYSDSSEAVISKMSWNGGGDDFGGRPGGADNDFGGGGASGAFDNGFGDSFGGADDGGGGGDRACFNCGEVGYV